MFETKQSWRLQYSYLEKCRKVAVKKNNSRAYQYFSDRISRLLESAAKSKYAN